MEGVGAISHSLTDGGFPESLDSGGILIRTLNFLEKKFRLYRFS